MGKEKQPNKEFFKKITCYTHANFGQGINYESITRAKVSLSPTTQQPINWMPYGQEALQKAADTNRPIFSLYWIFKLSLVSCYGE